MMFGRDLLLNSAASWNVATYRKQVRRYAPFALLLAA
jgi:hypothetical protein